MRPSRRGARADRRVDSDVSHGDSNNREQRHSVLDYVSPTAHEQRSLKVRQAADRRDGLLNCDRPPTRLELAVGARPVQLLGKVQTLDVPGIGPVQYIRLMLPSRN